MSRVFNQLCSVCGARATRVEIVRPDELPEGFDQRSESEQASFLKHRDPTLFVLIYNGIESGTGKDGSPIDERRAEALLKAFSHPPNREYMRATALYDNAGLCLECNLFYCHQHWNVSNSGYGTCPHNHGASLDPHWSPDVDFD